MYGSPSMSKDLNLPFPLSPYKQAKEDPDVRRQKQQPHVSSSGLLRYRTAPGNFLGEVCDETVATESMFARFMGPDVRDEEKHHQSSTNHEVAITGEFPSSDPPHMFFHSPLQHHQHQMSSSISPVGTGPVDREAATGGGAGNLVRHSSSPVGFLSHSNSENGFAGIRSMSGFGGSSEGRTSSGRLKGQISFSSQHISELGSESMDRSSPGEGGSNRCYIPGYPIVSLGDSVPISDEFGTVGRKRGIRDPSESQNHVPTLMHHFSLPKTATEVAAMERIMQFQDFVPCKIRAKRGCATHPRSVAERVRRTRISERMRKLQELVPNMDKQTNTADMLDFAVDYIKDLQGEAKMLSENRAKCTCSRSD